MSSQSALNNQTIDLLPKVKSYLNQQSDHYYGQFYQITLRWAMNSPVPLIAMTTEQLENFENNLLNFFILRKAEDVNYQSSEYDN